MPGLRQPAQGALRLAIHDGVERDRVRLDAELLGGQHVDFEAIIGERRDMGSSEEDDDVTHGVLQAGAAPGSRPRGGPTRVEGPDIGRLIGLQDVRATLAMPRTPDGQGIELDKFHTPAAIRFGPVDAPVNAFGLRRIMFAVDDIDAMLARMRAHGAEVIGEMRYGDSYRLAYIRGPEGIIVALAEQLG
ncbi:VOC family protein [Sorangium sp. So ce134]